MKKLLWILPIVWFLVIGLYLNAQAEPWLVCNPQSDADGYIYKLNGGAEVTVPYATQVIGGTTYAVIADCAAVPVGIFTYEVKAFKNNATWGRLESAVVPFSGTRPSIGGPSGVGIKR